MCISEIESHPFRQGRVQHVGAVVIDAPLVEYPPRVISVSYCRNVDGALLRKDLI